MKKLGKLTLNEMQEYAPLSTQEQMEMKGGISKIWWYIAYEAAKGIYEYYTSSGSSSPVITTPQIPEELTSYGPHHIQVSPDGSISITGSDSTKIQW